MDSSWRRLDRTQLLGLVPIAIWLNALIFAVTTHTQAFELIDQHAGTNIAQYGWEYAFWQCPLSCLIIGIGMIRKSKLLTGAGALWGIFPILWQTVMFPINPQAALLVRSLGFKIPFVMFDPRSDVVMTYGALGNWGLAYYAVEEFLTHIIGNIVFGIVGFLMVGIRRLSFLLTIGNQMLSQLYFIPHIYGEAGQAGQGEGIIAMLVVFTIFWVTANQILYHLQDVKEVIERNFLLAFLGYTVISFYLLANITMFAESAPLLMFISYFVGIGYMEYLEKQAKMPVTERKKLPRLGVRVKKKFAVAGIIYLVAMSVFLVVQVIPTVMAKGENPAIAALLFSSPGIAMLLYGLLSKKRAGN